MSDYAYERRTQFDNTFLIFENTNAHLHAGSTQIFEPGPLATAEGGIDVERIRRYVESRLHLIPRYRQRLARTPIENHPVWVDDDRFNIFYHVRHTRLPRPGDERLLKRVAGRVMSQQLDFHKPLWELWVIEGLEGGRFAIVHKSHHCMIDGISGADILSTLLSLKPTAKIEAAPRWIPRPAPSAAQMARDEALRRLRAPLQLGRDLWRVVRDEDHARRQLAERLRAARGILGTSMRNASSTPARGRPLPGGSSTVGSTPVARSCPSTLQPDWASSSATSPDSNNLITRAPCLELAAGTATTSATVAGEG